MRVHLLVTLITAGLASAAAMANEPITAPQVSVENIFAGQLVSLSNDQGMCRLARVGSPPLLLDMQWPCQFSATGDGDLRVETFDQTPILMVERSEHLPAPSLDCRTVVQAVRWYGGKLETARAQRIAMCGPGHWDQKMFMGVFKW